MPWSRIRSRGRDERTHPEIGRCDRWLGHGAAIREGLAQALAADERVFVMGQGVDDPGGMFGATRGLHREFGPERVFDTPLAENALMGIAVGAALGGKRPVYFHNRPDFLLLAVDQLLNHAAKWHYMFGGASSVPLVVWACVGRGWGPGAQHSQALHGLFAHAPGLKVVLPSTPYDAKGLLLGAIADENPVLILDHRFHFKHEGRVPEPAYRIPLGKAVRRRAGADATVVAVSQMVHEALAAAEGLAGEGIEVEVIDVRTARPLDEPLLLESAARTGRVVVADTGWKTGGVGAEIAALLAEKAFDSLRAPIARVACADVPPPASYALEAGFYRDAEDVAAAVHALLPTGPPAGDGGRRPARG